MPSATLAHLYQTGQWRQLRAAYLALNPLCEICIQSETVTPATTVHHADGGHRGDVDRFWAGPFQALCSSCHSRHGKLEDHGRQAVRFDASGWPI
ncbi:MAG: HNH endonuclease [Mesorhizobium sp.]|nr:MAG: HNH endonuclease [Mesorhizobium sp.]